MAHELTATVERRTRVRVVPKTYLLKVYFPGETVIAKDANYKCDYCLEEAEPYRKMNANDPVGPKNIRIMVTDNHAIPAADTDGAGGANLLGPGGSNTSILSYYSSGGRNWNRELRPAVPLKVEITKIQDGARVAIDPGEAGNLSLVWEVTDPPEEVNIVNVHRGFARPRDFLERFFHFFKLDSSAAGLGNNDNCLTFFGGARGRNDRVHADSVLFQDPFNTGAPSALPVFQTFRAKSTVTTEDGGLDNDNRTANRKIGISKVVFYPPPVRGDNYRFRLRIVDNNDRRQRVFNDAGGNIEYLETPIFTLWKKVFVDLIVSCNVDPGTIKWNEVQSSYRACHTEVVKPEGLAHDYRCNEATWKRVVKKYFRDRGTNIIDAQLLWNTYFLPNVNAICGGIVDAMTHYGGLAEEFKKEALRDLRNRGQRSDEQLRGLCVMLGRQAHPNDGGLLGAYIGDQKFILTNQRDFTKVFVHEMGHALFMRHSIPGGEIAAPVPDNNCIAEGGSNFDDHDQRDAIACVMSYSNHFHDIPGETPVEWHFCALCILWLRLFDKMRMMYNAGGGADAAVIRRYQEAIQRLSDVGLGTNADRIKIVHVDYNNMPVIAVLNAGNNYPLRALSRREGITRNSGNNLRKEITTHRRIQWHSSNPAVARFNNPALSQVTAVAAGNCEIWCTVGNAPSNRYRVRVT